MSSNKLILLTIGSQNDIRASLTHQSDTRRCVLYHSLSDSQRSVLEGEFLENPYPTTDHKKLIAERIGVDWIRVVVRC